VNRFVEEFNAIKKLLEDESDKRQVLETRITLADKICKNIEEN